MIANLVDVLFGCWHRNVSFPITSRRNARRSEAASVTGTYIVCLDCGKEFPYDWQSMKVVRSGRKVGGALAEPAKSYAAKDAA